MVDPCAKLMPKPVRHWSPVDFSVMKACLAHEIFPFVFRIQNLTHIELLNLFLISTMDYELLLLHGRFMHIC